MEVLGTAASVINLAIKIGNGIQQTHSFWKSVQDSSKEVVHIIDELNVFSKWLAVIADNYRRQPFERGSLSEAAAADTLKLCLGTVRKMNDSVRGYPRGRSFWRAGARKDQIATALRQLERMKTLLIVVQNCHHWHAQEVGFRSLMHAVNGYNYTPQCPAPWTTGSQSSVFTSTSTSSPPFTYAPTAQWTAPFVWVQVATWNASGPRMGTRAVQWDGLGSSLEWSLVEELSLEVTLGLKPSAVTTAVEIPSWLARW